MYLNCQQILGNWRVAIKKENAVTIRTNTGSVALVIQSIRRDGDKLVINGKALGTMSMDMIVSSGEVFNGLKLALCRGVISYLFLLPYYGVKSIFKR